MAPAISWVRVGASGLGPTISLAAYSIQVGGHGGNNPNARAGTSGQPGAVSFGAGADGSVSFDAGGPGLAAALRIHVPRLRLSVAGLQVGHMHDDALPSRPALSRAAAKSEEATRICSRHNPGARPAGGGIRPDPAR